MFNVGDSVVAPAPDGQMYPATFKGYAEGADGLETLAESEPVSGPAGLVTFDEGPYVGETHKVAQSQLAR